MSAPRHHLDALESAAERALNRQSYAGKDDPYGQHVTIEPDSLLALVRVVRAAQALHHFLWNERETFEPPSELLDQGYVAVETMEDYDKLEKLEVALGEALAPFAAAAAPPPEEKPSTVLGSAATDLPIDV